MLGSYRLRGGRAESAPLARRFNREKVSPGLDPGEGRPRVGRRTSEVPSVSRASGTYGKQGSHGQGAVDLFTVEAVGPCTDWREDRPYSALDVPVVDLRKLTGRQRIVPPTHRGQCEDDSLSPMIDAIRSTMNANCQAFRVSPKTNRVTNTVPTLPSPVHTA